ncbi:hypothetical protein [Spirosoma flavum]|uniref:Apea-like HEPN domain-containing protein n=1 Tax=Spirosoma flavum TaxID=2048557 RepID=A0ABW6AP81_9BACT
MTRSNNYTIEILFDSDSHTKTLFIGPVPYFGSASFFDKFIIQNDKIIIEAKRSAIIPLDNIFYNHFSSLYNQILKSLVFYYASVRKFSKITSIKILRIRQQKVLEEKVFNNKEFNQVLDSSFKLDYIIDQDRLQELFNGTSKGQTTLISISYILISNTLLNESDKFEKLWKSFNRLYTHIAGNNQDFSCLRFLRQFVVDHPNILTLSAKRVTSLTTDKLRNAIRWRGMFLDNYDTEAKTQSLKDFVIRYSDKRIMNILLETKYGYRETFLKNKGLFTQVETHIQNAIALDSNNDNEVVSLLTGKYMYFVRNKTFHGEKVDSSFRLLVNKEDNELRFLNSVLEPYLIDLINANDIY